MKLDVYQAVTDRIIGLLESGTVPWHQPWKSRGGPRNLISRKPYRGINNFLLNSLPFGSPFWLTVRQANLLGGTVKKGEKSCPVVFWKWFEEEKDGVRKQVPFLRFFHVFNVDQCENLRPVPGLQAETAEKEFEPIQECERVVNTMPQKPEIRHGVDKAFYAPIEDRVFMPKAVQFDSEVGYYSVLFHELTHATGHQTRLARKGVTDPARFGSEPYSKEELIAEMGAAFLCGHCQITEMTVLNSAGYIQNWLEHLKNDRRLVVQAAAQAQRACDFILGEKLQSADNEVAHE